MVGCAAWLAYLVACSAARHGLPAQSGPPPLTNLSTPHRRTPDEPCPAEVLHALGCRVWVLDPSKYPADPQLAAIRKARGYNYDVGAGAGGGWRAGWRVLEGGWQLALWLRGWYIRHQTQAVTGPRQS